VVVSLLVSVALWAEPDSPKAPAPKEREQARQALVDRVKKLVVQLDDDDQSRRDAAEKSLVEIGPDLLDVLPPPPAKASIELRARLGRVRAAVEKTHIEAFTRPSQITLHGKMKLSEAIASIERQSGNTLIDARERFGQEPINLEFTLDVEKATFWEALDKLLDVADLTVYPYSDSPGQLLIMNANPGDEPRSGRGAYAGLFRLEAKTLEATRDLRNERGNSLRIATDILWEPRLRPIVIEMPLAELKAIDDTGAETPGLSEGKEEYGVETTNSALELSLQLALPKRSVSKIASLKGTFTALVPGRVEKFEFADLTKKNVTLERGGAVVTFEEVRKNDEVQEVRMRLKFDKAANALESHRGWVLNNPAYLLDAKGEKIENGGYEPTNLEANEVGLSYYFDLEGVDLRKCRFVYETPAALFKIPVEFELKDLELP
jgi:hypothetical protein